MPGLGKLCFVGASLSALAGLAAGVPGAAVAANGLGAVMSALLNRGNTRPITREPENNSDELEMRMHLTISDSIKGLEDILKYHKFEMKADGIVLHGAKDALCKANKILQNSGVETSLAVTEVQKAACAMRGLAVSNPNNGDYKQAAVNISRALTATLNHYNILRSGGSAGRYERGPNCSIDYIKKICGEKTSIARVTCDHFNLGFEHAKTTTNTPRTHRHGRNEL